MNQHDLNEAEWRNPANWTWGVYRSARDTRVWVPKQIKWTGWTLNFAKPAAKWWMVVILSPALIVAGLCIALSAMR